MGSVPGGPPAPTGDWFGAVNYSRTGGYWYLSAYYPGTFPCVEWRMAAERSRSNRLIGVYPFGTVSILDYGSGGYYLNDTLRVNGGLTQTLEISNSKVTVNGAPRARPPLHLGFCK